VPDTSTKVADHAPDPSFYLIVDGGNNSMMTKKSRYVNAEIKPATLFCGFSVFVSPAKAKNYAAVHSLQQTGRRCNATGGSA
jgi:hypothetical protein